MVVAQFQSLRGTSTPIVMWIKLLCLATSLLALNFASHTSTIITHVTSPSIRRACTRTRHGDAARTTTSGVLIVQFPRLTSLLSNTAITVHFITLQWAQKFTSQTRIVDARTTAFSTQVWATANSLAQHCFQWTHSFELCNFLWPGTVIAVFDSNNCTFYNTAMSPKVHFTNTNCIDARTAFNMWTSLFNPLSLKKRCPQADSLQVAFGPESNCAVL